MKTGLAIFLLLSALTLNVRAEYKELLANEKVDISQIEKFAGQIEISIENGNPSYLNNSFDKDALLQKIMKEEKEAKDDYDNGFEEGFKSNFDLGNMIIDEIKNNGSYRFLRAYSKNDTAKLLFRLLTQNGINYHEFEVSLIDNEYKLTDVYLYMSGEKISETMQRIYKSFRLLNSDETPEQISSLQELAYLGKIKSSATNGKYKKAYKDWKNLPEAYKKEKLFLIIGIQIAPYLDDAGFNDMSEKFMTNYPENGSKYLIPLDGYLIHKNYSRALACIDSLDKKLNNDPMLNYFRANLLYEMGNSIDAAKKLSSLIESIPDFEPGYYSLLGLYVKDKEYVEATELLDKIVLTFNIYKDDVGILLKEFPEFINSQEFLVWQAK